MRDFITQFGDLVRPVGQQPPAEPDHVVSLGSRLNTGPALQPIEAFTYGLNGGSLGAAPMFPRSGTIGRMNLFALFLNPCFYFYFLFIYSNFFLCFIFILIVIYISLTFIFRFSRIFYFMISISIPNFIHFYVSNLL
jgi:hypothetical protein